MQIESGVWAAVGTLVGGIAGRIMAFRQKNFELKHDDLSTIRLELKIRCDELQKEIDDWQEKYYLDMNQMKESLFILRAENQALKIQLMDLKTRGWLPKNEHERYQ